MKQAYPKVTKLPTAPAFHYRSVPEIGTKHGNAELVRIERYRGKYGEPGAVLHWRQADGRITRTGLKADSTEGPSRQETLEF